MRLYLLTQKTNRGYDTYDSCVVCAHNPDDAVSISPGSLDTWDTPDNITVRFIGIADLGLERGVVCASFNAG